MATAPRPSASVTVVQPLAASSSSASSRSRRLGRVNGGNLRRADRRRERAGPRGRRVVFFVDRDRRRRRRPSIAQQPNRVKQRAAGRRGDGFHGAHVPLEHLVGDQGGALEAIGDIEAEGARYRDLQRDPIRPGGKCGVGNADAALAEPRATSVIAVGAASPCRYHVAVTEPAATPVSRELSTLLRSNNASLMPVESATMSP